MWLVLSVPPDWACCWLVTTIHTGGPIRIIYHRNSWIINSPKLYILWLWFLSPSLLPSFLVPQNNPFQLRLCSASASKGEPSAHLVSHWHPNIIQFNFVRMDSLFWHFVNTHRGRTKNLAWLLLYRTTRDVVMTIHTNQEISILGLSPITTNSFAVTTQPADTDVCPAILYLLRLLLRC